MHESVSRDARDNVGIMDRLLEYDHKKINCLILLDGKKVETANSLQHVQNGKRKIDGVHTKLQCLKRFQSNLGTLTKDFEKTTNQKDGGAAFAEDVLKLELRMKWVLKHGCRNSCQCGFGIAGAEKFCRGCTGPALI
jgi:hypothetical protein